MDVRRMVTEATERLIGNLDRALEDADARGPSLLPEWTRGHVVTHLARNANSHTWLLDGALFGEVRDQYPGGAPTRAAAIDAGAVRPAADLIADVRRSAEGLAAASARMTAESRERTVRTASAERPVSALVWSRLREIEVHHADLDLGYGPADWPAQFVVEELDRRNEFLAQRLPAGTALRVAATDTGASWEAGDGPASLSVSGPARWLLAWLLGRRVPSGLLSAPAGFPPLGSW